MTREELKHQFSLLVKTAEEKGTEEIQLPVETAKAFVDFTFGKIKDHLEQYQDTGVLTVSLKGTIEVVEFLETGELDTYLGIQSEGQSPDFEPGTPENPETQQEDPLSPEAIAKNLQHRRQKAKSGPGYGRPIPQVEIAPEDVEKALKAVKGVTEGYLEQNGFLTHIYRNAAQRTQTDISKINNGLFIKFE